MALIHVLRVMSGVLVGVAKAIGATVVGKRVAAEVVKRTEDVRYVQLGVAGGVVGMTTFVGTVALGDRKIAEKSKKIEAGLLTATVSGAATAVATGAVLCWAAKRSPLRTLSAVRSAGGAGSSSVMAQKPVVQTALYKR